jgi:hypothetical protein
MNQRASTVVALISLTWAGHTEDIPPIDKMCLQLTKWYSSTDYHLKEKSQINMYVKLISQNSQI